MTSVPAEQLTWKMFGLTFCHTQIRFFTALSLIFQSPPILRHLSAFHSACTFHIIPELSDCIETLQTSLDGWMVLGAASHHSHKCKIIIELLLAQLRSAPEFSSCIVERVLRV